MKKILILFSMLFLTIIGINTTENYVKADVNDYTTFSSINVTDGKLLRDYTDSELKQLYKTVESRKFSGWKYNILQKNVPVSFISSVVFSMYNSGTTAMKYKVNVTSENTVKTSISCTGSISYKLSGEIKKFKNGLDTALKIEGSYSETQLVKEQENLEVEIDPGTICVVYIQGEGLLTNGVASHYTFWVRTQTGGFEYFTITDSYLRIEKIKI